MSSLSAASAYGIVSYDQCYVDNDYDYQSDDGPFYPSLVQSVADFGFEVSQLGKRNGGIGDQWYWAIGLAVIDETYFTDFIACVYRSNKGRRTFLLAVYYVAAFKCCRINIGGKEHSHVFCGAGNHGVGALCHINGNFAYKIFRADYGFHAVAVKEPLHQLFSLGETFYLGAAAVKFY